jgi:hypothetical protein
MNDALAELSVIEVVRAGDPHPGGRASQYRYLLPEGDPAVLSNAPCKPRRHSCVNKHQSVDAGQ